MKTRDDLESSDIPLLKCSTPRTEACMLMNVLASGVVYSPSAVRCGWLYVITVVDRYNYKTPGEFEVDAKSYPVCEVEKKQSKILPKQGVRVVCE